MATRLHQILALEKGIKASTEGQVTRAYHDAQRAPMFNGLTRTYAPKDEEGERLPSERKITQYTVEGVIERAVTAWTKQADIVATKDATNQVARADIIVDGVVLAPNVPVTTLLYLEKMLQNVRELVLKLPVLDPEVQWGTEPDASTGLWRSEPEETVRTKKIPKAFTKAPATDKHPAQVEMFTEDVVVGYWTKTLFSGAMPAGHKLDLLRRIENLAESVKLAREYANQAEAVNRQIASALFDHLFRS